MGIHIKLSVDQYTKDSLLQTVLSSLPDSFPDTLLVCRDGQIKVNRLAVCLFLPWLGDSVSLAPGLVTILLPMHYLADLGYNNVTPQNTTHGSSGNELVEQNETADGALIKEEEGISNFFVSNTITEETLLKIQKYHVNQENSLANNFNTPQPASKIITPTFLAGTESDQPVCCDRNQPLKPAEVKAIMNKAGNYIKKMPLKPEPGTVWRFDDRENNQKNWRSQGYWWVEAGGAKYLEAGQLQKKAFNIRTPDSNKKRGDKGLQMFVWTMPNQHPGLLVIHIVGDKSLSVDMPHGNNKNFNWGSCYPHQNNS